MKTLSKVSTGNALTVLVNEVDIKPWSRIKGGMIDDGVIVKFSSYNINDLLCQLLDDYGEDELISLIKNID